MTMIVHLDDNKAGNELTGPIPTEIDGMISLRSLDLCKWCYYLDFFGILVVVLYELLFMKLYEAL